MGNEGLAKSLGRDKAFVELMEASKDAIMLVDTAGHIQLANERAERMFGYDRGELSGRPANSLVAAGMQAKHVGNCEKYFQVPRKLTLNDRHVDVEGRKKNGREFPIELSLAPVKTEIGILAVAIVRDVAERIKAEEELLIEKNFSESIVNNLPGIFYLIDPDGGLKRWNKNLEIVSRYSPRELAGLNPLAFFPEEEQARAAIKISEVFTKGRATMESDILTKEGRRIPYILTGWRVRIDRTNYLMGTGVDITDRKQSEEALKEKDRQIRQAYVDVFSAVTGDKLIIMTKEEIKSALGKPVGEGGRVSSFADLAGARAGLREILKRDFPAIKNPVDLVVAACEGLTNAIKHGGSGRYEVFRAGQILQIHVFDQGPGIDFSILPRAALFAGFSTKQTLGLGFSIMLEFCDRVLLSTESSGTDLVLEKENH